MSWDLSLRAVAYHRAHLCLRRSPRSRPGRLLCSARRVDEMLQLLRLILRQPRALTVHACRPIAVGEEICFNYGFDSIFAPRAERRERLQTTFGFECDCAKCYYCFLLC